MATERSESKRPRRRPDPLAVTLLAVSTFFVIIVLLAAQLHAGRDPGLATTQAVTTAASHDGSAPLVTRTSGGQVGARPGHFGGRTHAIVTRSSGGGSEGDD